MRKEKLEATPFDKSQEEKPSAPKPLKRDHRDLIIVVLLIFALFGIGAAAYLYYQNSQLGSDVDSLEVEITSLRNQLRNLEYENVDDKEDSGEYDWCQQEDESCGGMPGVDGVIARCCSGLTCDLRDVNTQILDSRGKCVVAENNENDQPQDDGGSDLEGVREDLGKYIIYNRKIVEIEEGSTIPGWDVVRTFEIEDQVEQLMINESETYFVYGVYLGDSVLGDNGPHAYWYDWYAYEIETGNTTKITGRKFEPIYVEGFEAETNRVWGWINDNEVLTGDDGMMVLDGAAIYNVDTGELRIITDDEWFSYRDQLYGY